MGSIEVSLTAWLFPVEGGPQIRWYKLGLHSCPMGVTKLHVEPTIKATVVKIPAIMYPEQLPYRLQIWQVSLW